MRQSSGVLLSGSVQSVQFWVDGESLSFDAGHDALNVFALDMLQGTLVFLHRICPPLAPTLTFKVNSYHCVFSPHTSHERRLLTSPMLTYKLLGVCLGDQSVGASGWSGGEGGLVCVGPRVVLSPQSHPGKHGKTYVY